VSRALTPTSIELRSGLFLDLADPDPLDIRLEDVARGLANTCRFAGQTSTFYSVAEHACLVLRQLERQGASLPIRWAGLHHDDPEAYIGDMPRPLKIISPEYRELESRVWRAIDEGLALGNPPIEDPAVKAADNWALAAEAFQLMPSRGESWLGPYEQPSIPVPVPELGEPPPVAERRWIREHERLLEAAASERRSA
jgi:hypothetical protein